MTDAEILAMVQAMTGDSGSYVQSYVDLAKGAVVSRLYPFREAAEWSDVPEKHHVRTCEIASYLVSRRGAEGETQHTESGVTVQYGSASIPEAMFAGMVPYAGVF